MTTLPAEVEANYEVLQTMGGGMGTVYKVRHRHFGETRIIKVMQASLADNQELKDRFTAEAKRGKQLKHRNIAEVLDYQIGSNGSPYLVMEYIDGINLRDEFVRRAGPLDPATVVNIGVQTLAALEYLHQRNLIHRDISPDNLMIARVTDGSPLIKLIDLGIAKSLEDNSILTQTGNFMGKVSYASPEQFGGVVDARSDIYSLGVVLYELLTAAKPITGANTAACIMAHCQKPPRPFSETDPRGHVPEALRSVVLKALEKKPEDRYQTAAEFSSALQRALPGAEAIPIAVMPPVGPREKTTPSRPLPAAPPTPSTLIEQAPIHLPAAGTVIIPAAQRNRGMQTVWLLVAVVAALIGIVFFAAVLLERIKNGKTVPGTSARSTVQSPAVTGQPSGASIAIVAPNPVAPPPRRPEPVAISSAAPVIIDEAPTTSPLPSSPPPPAVSHTAPPETRPVTDSPVRKIAGTITIEPETHRAADPPVSQQVAPPQHHLDLAEGDHQRKQALAFSNAHQWASAATAWRQFIHDYSGVNLNADHAAYYNLGVAYEALEQWNEAADAFERASLADINFSDPNNLLRLGRSYGKVGRWTDAVATYRRVLRIDPTNEIAKRSLLVALKRQPLSQ
jgi:serine/threonine protein kinase